MTADPAPLPADIDPAAIAPWLAEAAPALGAPLALAKIAQGQSNPTYRLECQHGRAVLRRKPFGPLLPSAHAIEREYRLIAALAPTGYPVPAPIALCEDAGVIGAPFYLMAEVAGRSFIDGRLPGVEPADRRSHYEAMIDTLAALHTIDPAAVGLADHGRPGNYFARQVERWTKQYRAAQTEDSPEIDRLIAWLPGGIPEQERVAIIHGDYRIDNLLFAPGAPRVAAVVDWELSTLGDPLADIAYLLMNWLLPADGRAGLAGAGLADLGIPTMAEAAARYCAATGRDGLPALPWLFAFNLFRLIGILEGVKRRMIDGNASGGDAARAVAMIPRLVDAARAQAGLAGAG